MFAVLQFCKNEEDPELFKNEEDPELCKNEEDPELAVTACVLY